MNRLHSVLLTAMLLLLLPISAMALNQGDKLLPFTSKDMDGKTVDSADIIGKKPVMLIFWSSWCPNCKSEVPKVNALVKKYRSQGMEFIGINVGYNDSEGKARRFMDKTGITYPVIFDTKGIIPRQYGVQGVPTVLVANKKGIVVFKNYEIPEISDEYFQQISQ